MSALILGVLLAVAVIALIIQKLYYYRTYQVDSLYIFQWLDGLHRGDWQAMWEAASDELRQRVGKEAFKQSYTRERVGPRFPKIKFLCSFPYPDGRRLYFYEIQFPGGAVAFTGIIGDAAGKFLAFAGID